MSQNPDEERWYVYVLVTETYRTPKGNPLHYVGIAKDVEKRLKAHNAGRGAKFTRGKGPWRILAVAYAGPNRSRAQWWEFFVRQLRKEDRASWLESHKYDASTKSSQG